LLSKPLIKLLLGNEWLPIIIYLQILLLASYGTVYQYIIRSIFKAIGLTKKILKINLFQNLVAVICILMASYWGINVLLWGVVIVNLFVTAYYCCQVRESINYSLIHQLRDNCCMIVLFVVSVILVVI
jgi:O-antigen/teichoic acid export membrane protein